MTEAEIRAMEAGPELDALVAERVLGWAELKFGWGRPAPGVPKQRYHAYSESVGAAFRVVEALRDQWRTEEEAALLNAVDEPMDWAWMFHGTAAGWIANIESPAWLACIGASAPTLPLAVCQAALLYRLAYPLPATEAP